MINLRRKIVLVMENIVHLNITPKLNWQVLKLFRKISDNTVFTTLLKMKNGKDSKDQEDLGKFLTEAHMPLLSLNMLNKFMNSAETESLNTAPNKLSKLST
jgi:hypothetical protein